MDSALVLVELVDCTLKLPGGEPDPELPEAALATAVPPPMRAAEAAITAKALRSDRFIYITSLLTFALSQSELDALRVRAC